MREYFRCRPSIRASRSVGFEANDKEIERSFCAAAELVLSWSGVGETPSAAREKGDIEAKIRKTQIGTHIGLRIEKIFQ